MGATLSAGLSLSWSARTLVGKTERIFETLSREAKEVAAGIRRPAWMPRPGGSFICLCLGHSRPHMICAIMEGVVFSLCEARCGARSRQTFSACPWNGAAVGSTPRSVLLWSRIKPQDIRFRSIPTDLKIDPGAKPLNRVSWDGFRSIVGDEWTPGKNSPFGPVAAKRAAPARRRVVVTGAGLADFERIRQSELFAGTAIGPE
jgi:hypothetical protein